MREDLGQTTYAIARSLADRPSRRTRYDDHRMKGICRRAYRQHMRGKLTLFLPWWVFDSHRDMSLEQSKRNLAAARVGKTTQVPRRIRRQQDRRPGAVCPRKVTIRCRIYRRSRRGKRSYLYSRPSRHLQHAARATKAARRDYRWKAGRAGGRGERKGGTEVGENDGK